MQSGPRFRLVNVSELSSNYNVLNTLTTLAICAAICETPCQNQGICIEPGRCTCPDNFYGTFCEKKKQLCLQPPKLPRNSQISIQAATCTVTCRKGHTFPDQTSVTNMQCIDGQWRPSRPEWTLVPDCLRKYIHPNTVLSYCNFNDYEQNARSYLPTTMPERRHLSGCQRVPVSTRSSRITVPVRHERVQSQGAPQL